MRIIFLGAPGAGKGTQAQIFASMYNIPKLSTGDMLRESTKSGSEIGKIVDSIMSSGNLVSDDIMIKIIEERLQKLDCSKGFILDGFPRTIPQAEALDALLTNLKFNNTIILFLDADTEELTKRISGRFNCANCGAGYHKLSNPPKKEGICDNCGAKEFTFRKDDNEESVKRRLQVYNEQTSPLIGYYDEQKRLKRINAMDSIENITASIEKVLSSTKFG
ncbi:adenylate kinase [endosymbiont of Acanthamoeba sp. UWC8]|uniref:adenylate kinase n=1 Tax=endosymbiont of Acanthamoeba sp. UWC8 TaxID=86106 RepID=UPI0004D12015|nr:adenylate kinase [endosymbiont of Acanthamoeba sp. UWC8]AIF81712.1 adenylate kinase [endosymbiont of Acanthamoeba sp. UWC8]